MANTSSEPPKVTTWETEIDEKSGKWKRSSSEYRTAPPTNESGRYVIYGAAACPWATRVKTLLHMLGLEETVPYIECDPVFGVIDEATQRTGWVFSEAFPDQINAKPTLKDVYLLGNPQHESKSTTPMLWDKQAGAVLHNESWEMIQLLHDNFRDHARHPEVDLLPTELREEIDTRYKALYEPLLNGVYRAGFATKQEVYDEIVDTMFKTLDELENHMTENRWLLGKKFTFADVILFPTLWRFDFIYAIHFKCSRRRIRDYPALSAYVREIYSWPVTRACNDLEQTRMHYYCSHYNINPHCIIAKVDLDWMDAPHGREALPSDTPMWFMQNC